MTKVRYVKYGTTVTSRTNRKYMSRWSDMSDREAGIVVNECKLYSMEICRRCDSIRFNFNGID